jgi:L-alanine-DL-glutamate epimerase-like enolase superfamily enzyme
VGGGDRDLVSGRLRAVGGPIAAADSQRRWSERRGWIVEIDGGQGEASPLPGVSRESFADCGLALERALAGEATEPLPPAARFALETALLDDEARRAGTSVAALLAGGPVAPAIGSELLGDPRDRRRPSPAAAAAKLKVGPAPAWPAQRRAIDELASDRPGLRLRLDFNGSLTLGEATAVLADIAARRWRIVFVEDPVAPADLDALDAPVPVAMDAGLAAAGGIDRAIALGVEVAVIKPALFGLEAAIAAARRLRAAGVAPVISHLLDGPIALAACAELACAVGGELAHGVGLHAGLAAYPAMAPGATIEQLDGARLVPRPGGLTG